jgi:hypothetical protein
VLEQLAGFYTGQRVVLICDGLSAHWSTRMRAYLDSQRDWLTAERLPLRSRAQPSRVSVGQPQGPGAGESAHDTLAEVADATEHGIQRVCKSEDLVVGFLAHTGLFLDL